MPRSIESRFTARRLPTSSRSALQLVAAPFDDGVLLALDCVLQAAVGANSGPRLP